MKYLVCLLVLCAFAAAYPRRAEKESKEDDDSSSEGTLYIVPLERSQPRRPSLGFDLSEDLVPPPFDQHPFFRSSNPWGAPSPAGGPQVDDFMSQMQEMMRELRRQLTELIHRSHTTGAGGLPDNTSVGTKIGGEADENLPQNKSTSTTKVIDGHVVTVNETTYSSGDDNIGAVFRIKVVEVKPSESPEEESDSDKSEEPSNPEEPSSPEVSKPEHEPTTSKSELEEDKHEETNEIPNPNEKVRYEWSPETDPSLNEIDEAEEFSVERFDPDKKANYYDLSGDTRVNDYVLDQAQQQQLVMMEPDAEFIEDDPESFYPPRMPDRMQRLSNL